jgi:hypothetical protein
MKRSLPALIAGLMAVGCATMAASTASAQTTGQVSGAVSTAAGKPVPSAHVRFWDPRYLRGYDTTADASGNYSISLPPGEYTVAATVAGQTCQTAGAAVNPGKKSRADIACSPH